MAGLAAAVKQDYRRGIRSAANVADKYAAIGRVKPSRRENRHRVGIVNYDGLAKAGPYGEPVVLADENFQTAFGNGRSTLHQVRPTHRCSPRSDEYLAAGAFRWSPALLEQTQAAIEFAKDFLFFNFACG